MNSPDEQRIAGLRKNENGGRRTVPIFVAVAGIGIVICAASRTAGAAEDRPAPARTSAAPTETSGAAEGPAYPFPPNPEEQRRIDTLTKALADSDARARDAQAAAEHALAEQRAQGQALKLRLDAMESALATSARRTESAPPVTTTRLGLSLNGFLQADVAIRQSAQDQLNTANAPLNSDRFNIRRARIRAALDREYVAGAVEFDGNTNNGPAARVLDAEASLRWPARSASELPLLMATIGAFKIPFGFEVGQSDRDRLFLERSTAERAFFPGEYDLGARLQGGWRFVRYQFAVMNGEPAGETSAFPGRDPNHQKDFVGRLGIDTPVVESLSVAIGVSGLSGTGFHPGSPATKPTINWTDRNQDGLFQPTEVSATPGTAATPSSGFTRQAVGADLRLAARLLPLGETTAYGEFYLAKNLDRAIQPADPKSMTGAGRDVDEVGAYVAVTQELSRHAMVGFRYDYYNPDKDSTDKQNAVTVPQTFMYQTFAFTAALQAPSGRLIVEYDVNTNHQGRDPNGLPTNLKDNAVSLRGEVKF